MALATGDSFFRLARQFVDAAGPDLTDASDYASKHPADALSAATNLSLATEIYLKALLANQRIDVPAIHVLPVLFRELSVDVQSLIVSNYEGLVPIAQQGTDVSILTLVIGREGQPSSDATDPGLDPAWYALLGRNANAFVIWRYLFAPTDADLRHAHHFEVLRLSCAAAAMRCTVNIPSKPKLGLFTV